MFRLLDHPSDLHYEIKIKSKNIEYLFEEIFLAVKDAIYSREKKAPILEQINLKTLDFKMLIHDFIEELIFLAYYENKYLDSIAVYITKQDNIYFLKADLATSQAFTKDYKTEIKACSYNINIKQEKEEIKIDFILDI